jgi:hypothetical protein
MIERRFGCQELPEMAIIKLKNNELQDEWADRILTLATKAFRNFSEHMNSQALLWCRHGVIDKGAGESVANMRPSAMDKAFDE